MAIPGPQPKPISGLPPEAQEKIEKAFERATEEQKEGGLTMEDVGMEPIGGDPEPHDFEPPELPKKKPDEIDRLEMTREEAIEPIRADKQEVPPSIQWEMADKGGGLPEGIPPRAELQKVIQRQRAKQEIQFRQTTTRDVPKDYGPVEAYGFALQRSERAERQAEEAEEQAEKIAQRVQFVEEKGRKTTVGKEGQTLIKVSEEGYVPLEDYKEYRERHTKLKQREQKLEEVSEQLIAEPQPVKETRYAREAFVKTPKEVAEVQVEEAGPFQRAGLEARTFLSTAGPRYIGASLASPVKSALGITTTREEVIEEKFAEDIASVRTDEPFISTVAKGAYGGLRSPPGRVGTAMLMGAGATKGVAALQRAGAGVKTMTALKGLGVAGMSYRVGTKGAEAIELWRTGQRAEAVGEVITTAGEIGAAVYGAKATQKRITRARIKRPRGRGKITKKLQKKYTPYEIERLQAKIQYGGDYPVKPSTTKGFISKLLTGKGLGTKQIYRETPAKALSRGETIGTKMMTKSGKVAYPSARTRPRTRTEFIKSIITGSYTPQQVTYGGDYPVKLSGSSLYQTLKGITPSLGKAGTAGMRTTGMLKGAKTTPSMDVGRVTTLTEVGPSVISATAVPATVPTLETEAEEIQELKTKPVATTVQPIRQLEETQPGQLRTEKEDIKTTPVATTIQPPRQIEKTQPGLVQIGRELEKTEVFTAGRQVTKQGKRPLQKQPQKLKREQFLTQMPVTAQMVKPKKKIALKQMAKLKQAAKPRQIARQGITQKMGGGMLAFPPLGEKKPMDFKIAAEPMETARKMDFGRPMADWIGAMKVEFEFEKATTPLGVEKSPITGVLKPVEEEELEEKEEINIL